MKKSKLLLVGSLLLGGISLSSCSFFGTDPYAISSVESVVNEDGSTSVTIKFSEDSGTPDYTFTIPAGVEGVGIADVSAKTSEDNTSVTLTITFTDGEKKEIIIPIAKGSDGRSIERIEEVLDEEGNTAMAIYFEGEDTPTIITLPSGDKGNGIASIDYIFDENNQCIITITLDDEREVVFTIPAGIGIASITSSYDENGDLVFTYFLTDPNADPIVVTTSTHVTQWFSGNVSPSDDEELNSKAKVGDFYFYIPGLTIYQLKATGWQVIANLGSAISTNTKSVHFNLNDSEEKLAYFVDELSTVRDLSFDIPEGRTFFDQGISVPKAYRTGYVFDGWYTQAEYNVTLGRFTDLVSITKDMELFARWIIEG